VTSIVRFTRQSGGALLVSTLVLLSGCAWIPKGEPPATYLEPPEMKETLAEVTSRLEQWPDDRWWEQFNNPELNQLMDAALKDNPGLKMASARLREAQGFVRVEGARLLPFLEADASLTYERISQHGVFAALNPEVAGARILLGVINPLSLRYEFDFLGKNRAMLEAALGQAAAEEAELAQVRLHLTTGIARAMSAAMHCTGSWSWSARSSICGVSFGSSPRHAFSWAWTMNWRSNKPSRIMKPR
jgi:outer membrane protein TolC